MLGLKGLTPLASRAISHILLAIFSVFKYGLQYQVHNMEKQSALACGKATLLQLLEPNSN